MYLCTRILKMSAENGDPLAQSVEHHTFNVGVLGSNPKRITTKKEVIRLPSLRICQYIRFHFKRREAKTQRFLFFYFPFFTSYGRVSLKNIEL